MAMEEDFTGSVLPHIDKAIEITKTQLEARDSKDDLDDWLEPIIDDLETAREMASGNYSDAPEGSMPAFVYIFAGEKEDSRIKIGVSNNPQKRLQSAQTTSPEVLRIAGIAEYPDKWAALWVESRMQERGKDAGFHAHGEWFTSEFLPLAKELVNQRDYFLCSYYDWCEESGIDPTTGVVVR